LVGSGAAGAGGGTGSFLRKTLISVSNTLGTSASDATPRERTRSDR
jgi:hypothetical protein